MMMLLLQCFGAFCCEDISLRSDALNFKYLSKEISNENVFILNENLHLHKVAKSFGELI